MNNNFPTLHRRIDHHALYFVDDVTVYKVNEDTLSIDITPTPYCEYYNKRIDSAQAGEPHHLQIYFPSNSSLLGIEEQAKLDSFHNRIVANEKFAYILEGHTDNQGNGNIALSIDRAKSVEQYYKSKFGISKYKFITYGMGSSDPVDDNKTEAGRQMNRRVIIQSSNITALQAIYRKGLEYLRKGSIDEAVKSFKIWIGRAPESDKMAVLHDPHLNMLKKNSTSWISIRDNVRSHYDSFLFPKDAFFLDSMYFVDQRYRTYTPISYLGYVPGLDTFRLNELNIPLSKLQMIDSLNSITIKTYLQENPFPRISEVGRRQIRAVCYVIIHSKDSTFISKHLPTIKANCLEGEAEWDVYATMYDKHCQITGIPQTYGTQSVYLNEERTKRQLYRIDDIDVVNERRRKIGLWPIKESIK